jgi:hypothetical protein
LRVSHGRVALWLRDGSSELQCRKENLWIVWNVGDDLGAGGGFQRKGLLGHDSKSRDVVDLVAECLCHLVVTGVSKRMCVD